MRFVGDDSGLLWIVVVVNPIEVDRLAGSSRNNVNPRSYAVGFECNDRAN